MATLTQILDSVPLGFRFKPNDVELVNHYLKLKILGEPFLVQIIPEIELCKHEPWDLPDFSVVKSDDPEWFFFCPRKNKYSNSTRSDRATEAGFWKVTGKDREIKKRGEVIGTKKTLVFYRGRTPNGVKTNWVIHEYHAVTFPANERTFVLCRLMDKTETKKTENQAEERSNALVYDEEQPSNHAASDYENQASVDRIPDFGSLPDMNLDSIFQGMPQAVEHDLPSFQQSSLFTEQETSFQNSPLPSTNSGNETTQEKDDFFNSLLAVGDVYYSEERQHAFVNDSIPSESLRSVYYESSDTDAEFFSLFGNVLDSSTACNRYAGSREPRVMKMVKTSNGAAHTRTQLASNQEASRRNRDSILFGDSSGGFTSDEHSINCVQIADELSINCVQVASSPSPPRRYSPASVNLAQKVAPRRQLHRKAPRKEKSRDEDQKEAATAESRKDQRTAQGTSSGKNLETARDRSSGVNKIGSFVQLETPLLSENPMPRSMYLLNVVVGLFLLLVTIWDLMSSAKC